jgi:Flp pilus assembly protein TadD
MGLKNLTFTMATALAVSTSAPAWQTRSAVHPRPDATGQRPPADPLHEAEDLLQKQQYAQAEEKLQPLMAAQAKNPQAWFDLGFAQSHQEKTKDAVASYQKAVDLAPDWFEANLNLGLDLVKAGNSTAAAPVLKHAVTLKPTAGGQKALARAWVGLGEALEKDDNDPKGEGAAAAYDKAAELNPTDLDLVVRSGTALQRAGDATGAEQRYAKAAGAGSSNGMSRLIALLSSQRRYNDASVWINKYLAQNPRDATARVQLAQLLIAQGKTEDAITSLEAARPTSHDAAIDRELALLYLDARQYDKAASLLTDLAQANPGDAQLQWDLGSALLHQRKYAKAESAMLTALKINPRLESDYWELAYAAQQNKHYELAIRVLDARAQRLKETPTTYWIRAVSYDSLGAVKPAATNYRLFLDADAGKSPDQEFQARHRLKAIEPQR